MVFIHPETIKFILNMASAFIVKAPASEKSCRPSILQTVMLLMLKNKQVIKIASILVFSNSVIGILSIFKLSLYINAKHRQLISRRTAEPD